MLYDGAQGLHALPIQSDFDRFQPNPGSIMGQKLYHRNRHGIICGGNEGLVKIQGPVTSRRTKRAGKPGENVALTVWLVRVMDSTTGVTVVQSTRFDEDCTV